MVMVKELETSEDGEKCLPTPSGKYPVGCQDLVLRKSGLLLRFFYPCCKANVEGGAGWLRWFPDNKYAASMARFKLGKSVPMVDKILTWLTQNPLIPATPGAPPDSGHDGSKFPLIIFSHGMGGFRTIYSSLLTDISSHGFFVAAVEHKDGSAAATFTLDDSGTKEWTFERKLGPEEDEYEMRNAQVTVRIRECLESLSLAERINEGSLPVEEFAPTYAPSPEFLEKVVGRIDTENTVISGHSFGGATVVKAVMSESSRFKFGVAFDSWMFPVQHEAEKLMAAWKASQPNDPNLFFLNCECFQGPGNLETMGKFEFPLSVDIATNVMTLKNASHYAATDVPVVMLGSRAKRPFKAFFWTGPKMKDGGEEPEATPLNPNEQLEACCDFFVAYLDHVLGGSPSRLNEALVKYKTHLIQGSNYKKVENEGKALLE